ncbi:HisA/HisF-related TIM barrel protein, partial [Rhizobium ruizarguesonis]
DKFVDQCIVVSIDAKRRRTQAVGGYNLSAWEIYTHGGRNATGIDAIEFAPSNFRASGCSMRRISSREARPPEAMTGME